VSEALVITAKVAGFPEYMTRLMKTTPEGALVDWKLMWRDPQPNWVSPLGRVVQVGDSAHTFLPHSGNGASQAIEDAISLATCLQVGGKSNTASATIIHNKLRYAR
jgi:2-polyprenyl-6-methoxyphenol hydroxylase-like FAD-dependent oxidoreductase